jgi:hypothetical protein
MKTWCKWCHESAGTQGFCSDRCRHLFRTLRVDQPQHDEPYTRCRSRATHSLGELLISDESDGELVGESGRAKARGLIPVMTYEEIGKRLGLSWQRIQQIEKEAFAKLRALISADPALAERLRVCL